MRDMKHPFLWGLDNAFDFLQRNGKVVTDKRPCALCGAPVPDGTPLDFGDDAMDDYLCVRQVFYPPLIGTCQMVRPSRAFCCRPHYLDYWREHYDEELGVDIILYKVPGEPVVRYTMADLKAERTPRQAYALRNAGGGA